MREGWYNDFKHTHFDQLSPLDFYARVCDDHLLDHYGAVITSVFFHFIVASLQSYSTFHVVLISSLIQVWIAEVLVILSWGKLKWKRIIGCFLEWGIHVPSHYSRIGSLCYLKYTGLTFDYFIYAPESSQDACWCAYKDISQDFVLEGMQ